MNTSPPSCYYWVAKRYKQELFEALKEIANAKAGFDPDDFKDFLDWLKHTKHRIGSEKEAENIINLIEEGDETRKRTGIDILFDEVEAKGIIKSAVMLINKGKSIQEFQNC